MSSFLKDVEQMNLLHRLNLNWKMMRWYLQFCGVDFLDGEYGLVQASVLYIGYCFIGFIAVLYTLFVAPTDVKIQSTLFVFLGSQGIIKFFCFFNCKRELHAFVLYVQKVYANVKDPATESYCILNRWSIWFYVFSKFVCYFFCATGSIFALLPLVYFAVFKETVLMMPIWLPYIDHTEWHGYFLTTLFHFGLVLVVTFGMVGNDVLMFVLILHVIPFAELFEAKVNELNKALDRHVGAAESEEMYQYIRNLIEIHKDMCRFIRSLSSLYGVGFFTETNTDGAMMMLSVYVALVIKWIPIYPFFFAIMVKLMFLCFLGTMVETMSDRSLTNINRIKFYMLPIQRQKDIMLMTCIAQRPTVLMSGTDEINLMLFVGIMKSVYSMGMLILQSVE